MEYRIVKQLLESGDSSSSSCSSPSSYEYTAEDKAFLNGIEFSSPLNTDKNDVKVQRSLVCDLSGCAQTGNKIEPSTRSNQHLTSDDSHPTRSKDPLGTEKENNNKKLPKAGQKPKPVLQAHDQDIICIRGKGGTNHPGNVTFRSIIRSNKQAYDKMSVAEKRELATKIFAELQENGFRFLRPEKLGRYTILDYERSVRKTLHALRDCRVHLSPKRNSLCLSVIRSSNRISKDEKKTQSSNLRKTLQIGTKETLTTHNYKVKNFDKAAKTVITKMLNKPDIKEAMETTWGEELSTRKKLLEYQLLRRFRAAAQKGISIKMFSKRLIPYLLPKSKRLGTEN